jgi:hypothetical protein
MCREQITDISNWFISPIVDVFKGGCQVSSVLAFTRCDKDQKRKWATGAVVGALSGGTGGIAGRLAGVVMGRFFR